MEGILYKLLESYLVKLLLDRLGNGVDWLRGHVAKPRELDSLEGWWLQRVDSKPGRRFSIAFFQYDKARQQFSFDGTNFSDDGSRQAKWRTISSHYEKNRGRIAYLYDVFDGHGIGVRDKQGFGTMYFDPTCDGKTLAFTEGYFMDVDDHDMAEKKRVVYRRLADVAREIGHDLGEKPDSIEAQKAFVAALQRSLEKELQVFETRPQVSGLSASKRISAGW